MPWKICLLLVITFVSAGCHGLPKPAIEFSNGIPQGYGKFKPRRGYLDKATYVDAARDDAQVTFRDFDPARYYLSGVFLTNYTGHEVAQKKVMVRFTRAEQRKALSSGLPPSAELTTTLLYQISASGRVLEVTRLHDDWEG